MNRVRSRAGDIVIGVDSSTQSTKVEARLLETGEVVAVGRAAHPPTHPPVSEQDPAEWWGALVEAMAQLGEHRRRVCAVSVGAQQHGMVVLDAEGGVLRPAKLWNDTTSAPQAAALVERHGAGWWAATTGSVPTASFTVTKLAWLAEHEPDVRARVASVMLPHDWLTYRLCGRAVTDRGDASGTGWWSSTGYVAEILGELGLPAEALPSVLGPTEMAGTITADGAAALELPAPVLVGPGTGDNMAAALGLGLRAGDVAFSIGTSGTVYSVSETPTADPAGAVAGFADATGRFLPLVCTLNATKVTDTVAHLLGVDIAELSEMAMTQASSRYIGGPVLVPYFDGERTPNRPNATGRLIGLRTSTTREQVALAAFDGVVCGLLEGLDELRRNGVGADGAVYLVGGGSRSPAYRQRLADLLGAAVLVPSADETVATGACVQAAAIMLEVPLQDVAVAWGLGVGITVDPRPSVDAVGVRERYREAAIEARPAHSD